VRASVSFPEDQYAELERIAQSKRVSLAWVVRDAVQAYLTTRWPLLEIASLADHIENENQSK
jgi:metal-responsive CopG/Arc/MetJ family transcriptional regulator